MEDRLLLAKARLCVALGDESTVTYLTNLKMWFLKVWTKEQFDLECRKLLSPEQLHLHNEFFLEILNKITFPIQPEISPKSSSAKRRKRRTGSERSVFEPLDLFDYLPEETEEPRTTNTKLHQPRFAAEELFLPDSGLILGRLLVVAWENGLANADEKVAEMLVMAVQVLLKNILTATIRAHKNVRTTSSGSFFYDVGCMHKNIFIRNTASRQVIDDAPMIDKDMAKANLSHHNNNSFILAECEANHQTPLCRRITMEDLYKALQDRNLIPCHSVYANNMERISQLLN